MATAAEDARLKAFDTVLEWSKQIVTIAAALLIFSTTFIREVVPDNQEMLAQNALLTSWGFLLTSVIFGLLVMGALAASLNKTVKVATLDVFTLSSRIMSLLQFFLFLAGIVLFMWFVFCNMS